MKMIAEYLERAHQFEQGGAETDDIVKNQFLRQAADYRKLAEKRAAQIGVSLAPGTALSSEAPPESK